MSAVEMSKLLLILNIGVVALFAAKYGVAVWRFWRDGVDPNAEGALYKLLDSKEKPKGHYLIVE